jgi:DNA-binding MarR family transcriptional regulator
MSAMYADALFISAEAARERAHNRKLLKKIERKGFAGARTINTFLGMGWIEFTTPSETNRYNHFRLTALGQRQTR